MNAPPPVTRRAVLVGGGAAGLGLALGWHISDAQPSPASVLAGDVAATALGPWLTVTPEGKAIVSVIATEMGQGSQTGVAQLLAEELEISWSDVSVVYAPLEKAFFIREGNYMTGGSGSISPSTADGKRIFDLYREAGAAARQMLVAAAAARWSVAVAECSAKAGRVHHEASGRSEAYGTLVHDAAKQPILTSIKLKPREEWRVIGKPVARLDLPSKIAGRAVYGIDVKIEGALVATLAQSPVFGGKLSGVDPAPALAIRGVHQVVEMEDAVVVVADRFWAALKGLQALKPNWNNGRGVQLQSAGIAAQLEAAIGAPGSIVATGDGEKAEDVEARNATAFAGARVFEAAYDAPYLSHSPIEPMNATAHATADRCELWLPCQDQEAMRNDVAKALELDLTQVIIHTTFLGGGFGRRLKTDYGVRAARLSRRIGKPAKLIWTREEDTQHGFYRPASRIRMRAAIAPDGRLKAIASIGATTNDTTFGGLSRSTYGLDSLLARQRQIDTAVPVGAWRSVDRSQSTFYFESFIDEIAHDLKVDPLEFRRMLLKDKQRDLRVLDTVAELAGWGRPPPGRALGLAYMAGWGTRVAQIAEVSVDAAKRLTVHRISCAFDPGTVVNPDAVKAQVEGGICMGLSAALAERITIKNGAVEQALFDSYPLLTLAQTPQIDVQLLESPNDPIGGVGEPPVPTVAPAVCNAVFAVTGVRIRSLPIASQGFTVV